MAKAHPIWTNFTGGEFSPLLEGRIDLNKYFNAGRILKNMLVHPHGPSSNRSGFRYIATTKDSSKKSRLIPFEFSTVQAYMLEFGHEYIRFYMDQGQIIHTLVTVDDWNNETTYYPYDYVKNGGFIYRCILEALGDATEPPNATYWIATDIYEIESPYQESELFEIKYAQSADMMWLTHPNHKPHKLSRTGHTNWTLSEYTPTADPFTAANDYPACVAFFEERLAFAATNNEPQTIWLSKAGDFEDITTGANDDDVIKIAIAADQVNVVRWMSPGKRLLLGTTGGEWNLGSSASDEPLTPTNIRVVRESAHGSRNIQPVRVSHVVLFVQKAGKKLRELTYSLEVDSYVAPDMSLLANHITKPQINEMDYQQEPFSIVWCVRSDGVLLGLTYLREHEVIAWHRHTTEGEFESVAVIPGTQEDELWAVVKRTIGETPKRYVELLESPFDDTDTKSAFFVDSGLSYDGEPTTTISGLNHLEGEEVTVLADGATHPNKTVSGNSITLDREASKVHVGLGYRSVLQTMRLEAGSIDGTAQGRIKRISKVIARLYKTLGCKIGPDEDTLDTIFFRDSSMPMDAPPELFTGDKELDYPEGYETDAHITIVQDLPLPLTVVALMPQIRTTDD